ncbi:SDR family NAD(P)-dependent oxidoreductase [Fulvivirga sedimenti]|uniref:SDR family oxidoreductase n=1 Tax=Fulvivirga sedimenti TaxID=2879465 RepID=A0A9X1HYJ6_9BACT|nr:SDR family oxidoreductase [Fulvivirga sedimenti]MCA6079077.1 SDR family oxidoreductase [Fulvivirga sedimenti]
MKEFTLITGASSGIGLEIARYMASKNHDVILVARRRTNLEKLQKEIKDRYQTDVKVYDRDLSNPAVAVELFNEIRNEGINVSMLVNNAGFGDYGEFKDLPMDRSLDMISVNISSLVALSRLFLEDAVTLNRGRILNVASILSFFPFPNYAVYAATKAFVLSFSESLRAELSETGISVSALCPGPTDTEFTTEEMLKSNSYKGFKQMDAAEVARQGVDGMMKGKDIIIPGLMNKIITQTPRFTPRSITRRVNKYMSGQKK